MALNAKNIPQTGGKDRVEQPELEAGVYPARIVQIIDYGLQPQRPFKGEEKPPAYEIGVTYELVDAFMVDEEGEELLDKPRWVSETFPLHNLKADLAKSTKRYKAVDPNEVHEGDWSKLLGEAVNVTIVINKKGDKVYTNVHGIAAMRPRDAQKCPELVNEARFFDRDNPDLEVFKNFPQWIQDKIKGHLEFKGSALEAALGGGEAKAAPKQRKKPEPAPEVADDDPPFDPDQPDDDNPY